MSTIAAMPPNKINPNKQAKRDAKKAKRAAARADGSDTSPDPAVMMHTFTVANRDGLKTRTIQVRASEIAASVATVSTSPLVTMPIKPGGDDEELMCMQNVAAAVAAGRGEARYGWTMDVRVSEFGPYVFLQHHAVLQTPQGLLDVTPRTTVPYGRPLYLNGRTMFLPDASALPIETEHGPVPLPNRFTPLTENDELAAYLAKLHEKAKVDGAADLERARRTPPVVIRI